jgi:multidrug transporter EmrE-like cation transporter
MLFSLLGEVIVPKRLSGVLSGAPSVAVASLLLTLAREGSNHITDLMAGMALGALAFIAYVLALRLLCLRLQPIIGSSVAWAVWLGVAISGLWLISA